MPKLRRRSRLGGPPTLIPPYPQFSRQNLARLAPPRDGIFALAVTLPALGLFWAGQQTQLNQFARSDHRLTWIHLAFLLAVVLMPFSTSFLAGYITYRLPMAIYWLNLLMLGLLLFISLTYATRAGLMSPETTREMIAASRGRIIVYQLLYFAACLLCVINTYVAIGALVLLQLNSVVLPPIRPLNRF